MPDRQFFLSPQTDRVCQHFLIPESVDFNLIKRCLLVYGVDKNWAWRASPATTLDAIEFDEKAQIIEAGEAIENQ